MKSVFCVFSFCFSALTALSQIPNGNFEEWGTIDTIENPAQWQTNYFYVGYPPIKKISNAIAGNYSMKISSTARDFYSHGSWPGYAKIKFMPAEIYQYMSASVQIDSIKQGRIDIRVKQRASDGFYYKIGGWKRTTVTNGVINIWFPIEFATLDTLLIEIWAFNKDEVFGGSNYGYSGAIIDNLALTNVNATNGLVEEKADWHISPNPANERIIVKLDQAFVNPCRLRLMDLQGKICQAQEFQNLKETILDISGLPAGVYVLEMTAAGELAQRTSVVVVK